MAGLVALCCLALLALLYDVYCVCRGATETNTSTTTMHLVLVANQPPQSNLNEWWCCSFHLFDAHSFLLCLFACRVRERLDKKLETTLVKLLEADVNVRKENNEPCDETIQQTIDRFRKRHGLAPATPDATERGDAKHVKDKGGEKKVNKLAYLFFRAFYAGLNTLFVRATDVRPDFTTLVRRYRIEIG